MPWVGFEPTTSAGERPKTYVLDRAATGTGFFRLLWDTITTKQLGGSRGGKILDTVIVDTMQTAGSVNWQIVVIVFCDLWCTNITQI